MKLRTFKKGGIHPSENKLSALVPVKPVSLPERVYIHLSQHLGAPAVCRVARGDKVKVGTLIARGEAFISANIHSSVSGTVESITKVVDISGYKREAIVIKVEGDEWEDSIDRSFGVKDDIGLSPEEIVDKIKEMGIVGLGGASFPTHIKYMIPDNKKADTLIINGAECEPYLTADHSVMLERPEEILKGVEIMMKAGRVSYAMIGIEENKDDAIFVLSEKAKEYPGIEVLPLKVKYPQGAEKQLIKTLLNREIPSMGLPVDVGCIINNISTALAVYEAVQKNKPLVERVVTLTGRILQRTGNFRVRIGTPAINMLKELQQEIPPNTGKILFGGPMMGKVLYSLDTPVTKGTSGIILMEKKETKRRKPQNCLRCGKCLKVCPMGLEPYLLEKLAEIEDFDNCEREAIVDCIECGSCSYTCPSSRPLLDYIRHGKASVLRIMRERRGK